MIVAQSTEVPRLFCSCSWETDARSLGFHWMLTECQVSGSLRGFVRHRPMGISRVHCRYLAYHQSNISLPELIDKMASPLAKASMAEWTFKELEEWPTPQDYLYMLAQGIQAFPRIGHALAPHVISDAAGLWLSVSPACSYLLHGLLFTRYVCREGIIGIQAGQVVRRVNPA